MLCIDTQTSDHSNEDIFFIHLCCISSLHCEHTIFKWKFQLGYTVRTHIYICNSTIEYLPWVCVLSTTRYAADKLLNENLNNDCSHFSKSNQIEWANERTIYSFACKNMHNTDRCRLLVTILWVLCVYIICKSNVQIALVARVCVRRLYTFVRKPTMG